MWQDGLIWEAESAINRARARAHLKPLQQRNVLGMVDEIEPCFLDLNRGSCVDQYLDRITLFKVVLAHSRSCRFSRELPVRRRIADERIGERLRQFMAERGHVLEAGPEQPRRDPACELADEALLRKQSVKVSKI